MQKNKSLSELAKSIYKAGSEHTWRVMLTSFLSIHGETLKYILAASKRKVSLLVFNIKHKMSARHFGIYSNVRNHAVLSML